MERTGPATVTGGHLERDWNAERRAALLARVPLFARVPPAVIREVAALFRPRAVPRGDFVFREGEPANAVHVAAIGRIKIVRETEAGRQVVLRLIHPGSSFGVSGVWGTATYPASARALDEAVILHLPSHELARLMTAHAPLALAMITDLGARLREAEARILDLETEGVEARLARALLRLAAQSQPPTSIALTRQDLADLTGTTLTTASRTLSAWHRQGIVAALRERVVILDRTALQVIAGGA